MSGRMDNPLNLVTFKSDRFTPFLPEMSQVSPEVYGAELTYWLSAELAHRGVFTSYPESEDWGWYIELITTTGSEYAIFCGNVTGTKNRWTLAPRHHAKKMFGRDRPPYAAAQLVDSFRDAVQSVAAAPDIEWHYSDSA